jgi:hypothetical protein
MAGVGEGAELGSFGVGVSAGLERAKRYDLAVSRDALEESLGLGREVLESRPEPISPRSAELYAELVTIASVSRLAYEHEPLTREQLASYLEHSLDFWNSWGHLY